MLSSSGPTGGGNTVTITGSNLAAVSQVKFGSYLADSFTNTSATTISAVVPAEAAGTIHITLSSAYGTSSTGSSDQ